MFFSPNDLFGASGFTWERFRLRPALQVTETYTDNIYLTKESKKEDFITVISPQVVMDIALVPRNIISLLYKKNFGIYQKSENIEKDADHFGFLWGLESAKGSTFKGGISYLKDSIQPYSAQDQTKDYDELRGYADSTLKVGSLTELNFHYSHGSRRYKDIQYEQDEYSADTAKISLLYKKFSTSSLLVEYDVSHQDFHDISYPSTDFLSHAGLIGIKWDVTSSITGAFKIGYTYVDFKDLEPLRGILADTDLTYKYSNKTSFALVISRSVQRSIRVLRETNYYYISTGGSLGLAHDWTSSLNTSLFFEYTNYEFDRTHIKATREDNNYGFSIKNSYNFSDWLSLSLSYVHRLNDSNLEAVNYRENAFHFTVSIFPKFMEAGEGGL